MTVLQNLTELIFCSFTHVTIFKKKKFFVTKWGNVILCFNRHYTVYMYKIYIYICLFCTNVQ